MDRKDDFICCVGYKRYVLLFGDRLQDHVLWWLMEKPTPIHHWIDTGFRTSTYNP